jgi:hypothetical protein
MDASPSASPKPSPSMLHGVETLADLQPNGDVPQEVPAINDGKPSRINGREYTSNMSEKATISSSSTNADTPGSREVRKKSGGPKGKNAVRTKSGCYTCRLAPLLLSGHLSLPTLMSPIVGSAARNVMKSPTRTAVARPVFASTWNALVLASSVLNGSGYVPPY